MIAEQNDVTEKSLVSSQSSSGTKDGLASQSSIEPEAVYPNTEKNNFDSNSTDSDDDIPVLRHKRRKLVEEISDSDEIEKIDEEINPEIAVVQS